jgi:Kef-type K+ transport system membrane component KefB
MSNNQWFHAFQLFNPPFASPVIIFTLVLLIILIAPALMARIKMPDVVGFIVAGIAIGPYGLNWLTKNAAVDLFSTIGLLYIIFIAGIELDLVEFKKRRHRSLAFGFLTFIIPIAIGFPACYFLLHYSFITSLLTSGMFATHTLVAYPIVSKYKLAGNEAVSITVGGTILNDSAALILLAVITSAKAGSLTPAFWIQLIISAFIFIFLVFVVLLRVAVWFLYSREHSNYSRYIFVLTCMFFSALLAQMAGVEPIIGAFAAAIALNPLIPKQSTLFSNVEFVGKSIFIPFFFISVGMIVNLHVLFNGPGALTVAICLTTVALAGKWLSAFFIQKMYRYTNIQRSLMFGLSSSHAAATLAIILIGYKANIIDANILNGTILLILVTCMVASFTTERACRKLMAVPQEQMVE